MALSYEVLGDQDGLRHDLVLPAVLGKPGSVLAGKSTVNRLGHAFKIGPGRNHKLGRYCAAIKRPFVERFLDAQE